LRRSIFILAVLLSGSVSAPVSAQDEGGLAVFALAGTQNKPTGFDVARNVDYGSGFHAGGGLVLTLYKHVAIRAEAAYAFNSGDETGAITDQVELNRLYGSGSLELRLPLASGFTPYIFGGGGVVNLHRNPTNTSYEFDLTEGAGVVGLGASYRLGNSPLSAFVQVSEWVYSRSSASDQSQYDTVMSVGVSYSLVGGAR
jgi:hypothetical protein